jgi:hypothetical protein
VDRRVFRRLTGREARGAGPGARQSDVLGDRPRFRVIWWLGETSGMTMVMCRIDRLLLAVHSAEPPTDDEWHRWFDLIDGLAFGQGRALIETYGPCGPSASQRKELAVHVKRVAMRSVLFTDSVILRGMVTAMAWFGVALRAFPPGQYAPAAEHLGLSSKELASALEGLARLRRECGLPAQAHLSLP